MALYKVARTARSKHVGAFCKDAIEAKYIKERAGIEYHIYELQGKVGSGKVKWVMIMK